MSDKIEFTYELDPSGRNPFRPVTEDDAEKAGYDCGKNGPTRANCSWIWFTSPKLLAAWQFGKAKGEMER